MASSSEMKALETKSTKPTNPTKLTYDDYAALPDDGRRYELLAGDLYMVPAPGFPHQRAVGRLFQQLVRYFEGNRLGEVFVAPLDVVLSDHDVAEPDILVVTKQAQFSKRGIEGPPSLVVEVLSPSNRNYDRVTKAARYLAKGVQHYWIVDPEARHLICQRADGDRWTIVAEGRGDDTVSDPTWPDVTIRLGDLWKDPWDPVS